jgi:hypothetical protein
VILALEKLAAKPGMLKLEAILNDGSVAPEFMVDNPSEAEEMRRQMLDVDGVAEVRILDEPGWVRI